MPRFTPAGPKDTPQAADGDGRFTGVLEKGEPDQLPAGALRELLNGTCRDGTCRTRLGSQTPTSLQMPDLEEIFGSGVFSDPLQVEWLLLATASGIWRLRDGHTPQLVATPEPIAARVTIAQAFRTVLIFRGADLPPWTWNGEAPYEFVPISQEAPGSNEPIPNGPDRPGLAPVVLQNRLIIPHGRSQIAVSDIFDYTSYDPIFADFNVTGGNDDVLTALFRYASGALLVFNTQSVQRLVGIEPTLEQISLEPVNDSIGCVAGGTVARLGNDVLFLSDSGVFPLSEVEQRRQVAPTPLSDPIEQTFARVNWRAAAASVACVVGEYYYLAVPLDGATSNNALLPFNSASGAWEGIHTFPAGVQLDALHALDWFGRKRLHAVDYASGRVHLLYEGRHDVVGDTVHQIAFTMTTRAFLLQMPGRKRFQRGQVYLKTWAPRTSAHLSVDGINESTVLASALTRDRTQIMVFGQQPYATSNVNDDHGRPHRADYSVDITTAFDPDDAGIDFDLEQHHRLAFTTPARGRHASLTIENDQGTAAITAVLLEGAPADITDRPAA